MWVLPASDCTGTILKNQHNCCLLPNSVSSVEELRPGWNGVSTDKESAAESTFVAPAVFSPEGC